MGPDRSQARDLDQAQPSHQAKENRAHAIERDRHATAAAHGVKENRSSAVSRQERPLALSAGSGRASSGVGKHARASTARLTPVESFWDALPDFFG